MVGPLERPVRWLLDPRRVNLGIRPNRWQVVNCSIADRCALLECPMSRVVLILLAT